MCVCVCVCVCLGGTSCLYIVQGLCGVSTVRTDIKYSFEKKRLITLNASNGGKARALFLKEA